MMKHALRSLNNHSMEFMWPQGDQVHMEKPLTVISFSDHNTKVCIETPDNG
jgi:hypothetical protein